MGDLPRDGAPAADDECVRLLGSSETHEHYDGESLLAVFPSATREPPNRTETRPTSISSERIAHDPLPSTQGTHGHRKSSTLDSRPEIRPALPSREAEQKSWIRTVFHKLRPHMIARVKSSRDVYEPTQGDGHEEGRIWSEGDEKFYPMTILPDPGSQYNIIDPTFAHRIFPSGFEKVPEGSGGRMIDGSFLGFQGSVRVLWHVENTRFPKKIICTVFMVAERAIEYNLLIGKDEIRRHKIDRRERRGGIFSFIRRPNAIDPTTSASFTQEFNHDEAQERAFAARERWGEHRDRWAISQATRLLNEYKERYKRSTGTMPSFEFTDPEWRRLLSEAQAEYARLYPPPSS